MNLTPSLGVGLEASVWRSVYIGLYGGFSYSAYGEGLEGLGYDGPERKGFFGGELRLTLPYAFDFGDGA